MHKNKISSSVLVLLGQLVPVLADDLWKAVLLFLFGQPLRLDLEFLLVGLDGRQAQLQVVGTLPLRLEGALVPFEVFKPQRRVVGLWELFGQVVDVLRQLYRFQQDRFLLDLKLFLFDFSNHVRKLQHLTAVQTFIGAHFYQIFQQFGKVLGVVLVYSRVISSRHFLIQPFHIPRSEGRLKVDKFIKMLPRTLKKRRTDM